MAQMHTLVLNGQSYTVTDPTAARIDDTKVGADTWSSKNIIDRLCPSFSAQDSIVTCQPVEGYPLTAVTHIPESGESITALTLRQIGKNHFKPSSKYTTKEVFGVTYTVNADKSITFQTGENGATRVSSMILLGESVGMGAQAIRDIGMEMKTDYTLSTNQVLPTGVQLVLTYYKEDGTGVATSTINPGQTSMSIRCNTSTMIYIYLRVETGTVITEPVTIYPMIERGSVMTDYEPYWCEEKKIVFDTPVFGCAYNWTTGVLVDAAGAQTHFTPQTVNGHTGANQFYSNTGETEVAGRTDPNAVIQDLYSKLNAVTATLTAFTGG